MSQNFDTGLYHGYITAVMFVTVFAFEYVQMFDMHHNLSIETNFTDHFICLSESLILVLASDCKRTSQLSVRGVILTHANDDCNSPGKRNCRVGKGCLSWEGHSIPVSLINELYFSLPFCSVIFKTWMEAGEQGALISTPQKQQSFNSFKAHCVIHTVFWSIKSYLIQVKY